MGSHDPHIPVVIQPLPVEVADGEIVVFTQHDAASLSLEAALETAHRLLEAAKRVEQI